jgi:hypothetical protein
MAAMIETIKPSITLLIAENEKAQGKDVKELFEWKPTPHNRALWVYLNRYVTPENWQSIYLFVRGTKAYDLRGDRLTEASVTAMQAFIFEQHSPVTIRLVKKPGAPTKIPTQTKANPASAAYAPTGNNASLRELLNDLDNMSKKYKQKYRV